MAYISDFQVTSGRIRVWCENWSKKTELKRRWIDGLAVSASSYEIINWLRNKSR